jgi:hypothetical protein
MSSDRNHRCIQQDGHEIEKQEEFRNDRPLTDEQRTFASAIGKILADLWIRERANPKPPQS